MEKTLNIYSEKRGDNTVIRITHSFERDEKKENLHISNSEEKSFQKKLKAIHDKLKTSSNYVGTYLNFDGIDSDTSDTNMYLVPYFGINKGNRKVSVGQNDWGYTPKGWTEDLTVTFKNCKQYGAVLKAVKELGYTLDATEVKDLKKALKEGYEFEKLVEVKQSRTYW